MTGLAAMLAAHDEAALTGLASKGLVRRAARDLSAGKATLIDVDESAAQVIADGQTVQLDSRGPAAATCTCSAQRMCRHILLCILFLREASLDSDAQPTGSISAREELCSLSPAAVKKFAGADWARAAALLADATAVDIADSASSVTVTLNDLDAKVTFIAGQSLREAAYKGAAARKRVAVTLGVLHVRASAGVAAIADERELAAELPPVSGTFLTTAQTVVERAVRAVLPGRAAAAVDLLLDLSISSRVEVLPRVAAELRGLSNYAALGVEQDVGFVPEVFCVRAARVYALLEALKTQAQDTALSGVLRRDYTSVAELDLALLGASGWQHASGARGLTLHAYSQKNAAWYAATEGRAAGTDPSFNPHRVYRGALWGTGPLCDAIGRRFTLREVGVAADNAVRMTPPDGDVTATERLALDALLEADCTHREWSSLRADLVARFGSGLRRRAVAIPAVVAPARFAGFAFNDIDQNYEWQLLDAQGDCLVLSIPGNDHRIALQLRAARKQIFAFLVEATATSDGVRYRPVTVFLRKRASSELVNLDFDDWSAKQRSEGTLDKLRAFLSKESAAMGAPPDPVRQVLNNAQESIATFVAQPGVAKLGEARRQSEAVGLLTLATALAQLEASGSVPAALRAAYVASESEAALLAF